MKVVPFNLFHLNLMHLDESRPGILGDTTAIMTKMWVNDHFSCYTILEDDLPIVCAGALRMWKGVGEIYIYVGSKCWDKPKTLFGVIKIMKSYLHMFMCEMKLHRLQGYVPSSSPECLRFAELFGFKQEGTMKMFTTKKNDVIRVAYHGRT